MTPFITMIKKLNKSYEKYLEKNNNKKLT